MRLLVGEHARRDCRCISKLLRAAGWTVIHKRGHRPWKHEAWEVLRKPRKKRSAGVNANVCGKRNAVSPNDVRTWDFIHDRLVKARAIMCLNNVGEISREREVLMRFGPKTEDLTEWLIAR